MKILFVLSLLFACFNFATAQVNSGSNGSDGAFNPTTNTVIDMADHPTGIYHYTTVSIPAGVAVTFTPNSNNTPVVWLVQGNVFIHGAIIIDGENGSGVNCAGNARGGRSGPGGWAGGGGGVSSSTASSGLGPGGGQGATGDAIRGANASYAVTGTTNDELVAAGTIYGNRYLIPLMGGSGGGGATAYSGVGGGGGGGALLVCASGTISIDGNGEGFIRANGGPSGCGSGNCAAPAGAGSGGAVRLVASKVNGTGWIYATGGLGSGNGCYGRGGLGRIRFDTYDNSFSGGIIGDFSSGFQPIIIPVAGQLPQLTVTSVGGITVSASPTGVLSTPDAVISAQQNNPIPVVVRCSNLPLNSQITVTIKPANGPAVTALGVNNAGTLALSTATVSINIPRGGGLIYATAATAN